MRNCIFNIFSIQMQKDVNLTLPFVCIEVLRPVNPMRSCRARSVYLTTRLLGRLSPLSG